FGDADLWSREPYAIVVIHGIEHILGEFANRRIDPGNLFRFLSQDFGGVIFKLKLGHRFLNAVSVRISGKSLACPWQDSPVPDGYYIRFTTGSACKLVRL